MRVAIIGTGFLGEQIYKDISADCDEVILTHRKNKKYPNSKKFDFFVDDIGAIFENKKIDLVFLAAKIEFTKNEALLKNRMTHFLKACQGSRVVYISSDGIFDGKRGRYKETDSPEPVTLYGKNLKICEDLVLEYSDNYCIIRPSYLYGFVNGVLDSRFRGIKKEVSENKKIIRFTDMYKSPLSYMQASRAIMKIAFSKYVGIVHISGERMSVYDFARKGMEALGISTKNLVGEMMPKERPVDFLPDTSLDFSLMKKITGIGPVSVGKSSIAT